MIRHKRGSFLAGLCLWGVLGLLAAHPQLMAQPVPRGLLTSLRWRPLGPAVVGGRVTDVAVDPRDHSVIYVAGAGGGVFKSTNRGGSFRPIFDGQPCLSIGALALSPARPEVLWVGTGEANNQRSSPPGVGVFKSEDGGRHWKAVGLEKSRHIGRVVPDPHDPLRAYVAALGSLHTPNSERGLYRTRDGGRSWELVLQVDENTGVVDVVLDERHPHTLYAATYERRRQGWNFVPAGPGSGIYKSSDGGETWARLKGGLPKGAIGRIGLALATSARGSVLYACVENRNPRGPLRGPGDPQQRAKEPGARNPLEGDRTPRDAEDIVGGEIYCSTDGGESFEKRNREPVGGVPAYYFGQIRVVPGHPDHLWLLGVQLFHSEDGGRTWKGDGARGIHVDQHALWIDPRNPRHMILGNDGGLAFSEDGGQSWDVLPNLPLAQVYRVAVDNASPYRIFGGLQDNGSIMMPSRGATSQGILEREIFELAGGDGFYCLPAPDQRDVVYLETQFGCAERLQLGSFKRHPIRPPHEPAAAGERFNWMTPLVISPHNPGRLYMASQRVWQSDDRGDHWRAISPDLTRNDPSKITGNVPFCTITSLSASPCREGVIWVGTDDGQVDLTLDGGRHWRNLHSRLPKEVAGLWVSGVKASHHQAERAYVSFTGDRQGRLGAWLLVTEDLGQSWTRISSHLPPLAIHVVWEDALNPDLLFIGTQRGAFVSLDRGERWHPLARGLPPVSVRDLAIQERHGELVAGTYGRGLFVLDVSPLRELGRSTWREEVHLMRVKLVPRSPAGFFQGSEGVRAFRIKNPRPGATIRYLLREAVSGPLSLEVQDVMGRSLRRFHAGREAGLHRFVWDLAAPPHMRQGRRARGRRLAPGDYLLILKLGQTVKRRTFTIPPPPRPELWGDGRRETSGTREGS